MMNRATAVRVSVALVALATLLLLLAINDGALFGNAMTRWDHETGSVWSQSRGEAIMGELKGVRLEPMASTLSHWSAWREAHPETLALDTWGFPIGRWVGGPRLRGRSRRGDGCVRLLAGDGERGRHQ